LGKSKRRLGGNARALGLTTIGAVKREFNRLGKLTFIQQRDAGEVHRAIALGQIVSVLDLAHHFDRRLALLFADARQSNKNARIWIGRSDKERQWVAAHVKSETRNAKAA
jgi:hypothetical protein